MTDETLLLDAVDAVEDVVSSVGGKTKVTYDAVTFADAISGKVFTEAGLTKVYGWLKLITGDGHVHMFLWESDDELLMGYN